MALRAEEAFGVANDAQFQSAAKLGIDKISLQTTKQNDRFIIVVVVAVLVLVVR